MDAVRPAAARVAALGRFPSVAELDALLRERLAFDPGVVLEPQVKKRRRRAPVAREALYAARIHLHRRVPTREGSLHDLFNAFVWAAYPRAKRALAARQYTLLAARVPEIAPALPNARSREEDGLAMLDEGGLLLLVAGDAAERAAERLRALDAGGLAALRDEGALIPLVFGHSLLEHLAGARGDVRARGVVVPAPDPLPAGPEARTELADRLLAAVIAGGRAHEGGPIPLAALVGGGR